jgi:hypothetical protein
MCSITHRGFWVFGVEGFCTRPCQRRDGKAGCPEGFTCQAREVTMSSGTRLQHRWTTQAGYFCVRAAGAASAPGQR